MTENRWMGVFGALLVGLLLTVTAVPVKTTAFANNWWNQDTGQDFAGDTQTNVHVCNVNPGFYFVHLEDNESETDDFSYVPNPAVPKDIWDKVLQNQNVNTYSQSFVPGIDGVIDQVDLRVYRVGVPKTPSDENARLTIKITDAAQNGNYAPIEDSVLVEWTFTYSQVPLNQGMNTFILTEYDSCYSTPLEAGTVYSIIVTSDAAPNQQQGVGYYWDADVNQDTSGTSGCRKGYDQNNDPEWSSIDYDIPFKVYVHNFVHSGDIVSSVHDCLVQVTFSETSIDHREGGELSFKVRTGPTSSPDGTWTDWVDQGYGSQNPGLDPNRYVQFKIEFTAGDDDLTTEGVDIVNIGWL